MSVRLRVIFVIVLINFLIILFSVYSGAWLVSQNIKTAQETDMQVVADIADRHISSLIELLHLKAADLSRYLVHADEKDWTATLLEQADKYPEFIGLAVFDAELGRIAAAGECPPPQDAMETTHIAQALKGKKMLKTTYPRPNGDGVVFYAAIPARFSPGKLLAVTIPGTYFREKLVDCVIWETGHVFMIDPTGTFVSNPREPWVLKRDSIPALAAADQGFAALAVTAQKMASGEAGIGYYTVYGVPRVCAYRPVAGSEDGWSLGAVAPLPESPFRFINIGLLTAGAIGVVLGIIAAIAGSPFITSAFEKVEALKEEAEQNSKYKSQFLANMSHEMRTPLTAVIGLTELTLKTVQLDDETYSNLVKVYRAGETLLLLINDLLDISKIEANRFTLNPREYDVPSMLNDTITQSIMYIESKPVTFVLDIRDDLPSRLYGDELRVKQILNNLLSNAFKFTKEGMVELGIRHEREGDSVWLTAWVHDTGSGIKPEGLSKLFTTYSRLEEDTGSRSSSRRTEGTGLGLSISKKAVEMMAGSITVETEYGKGSRFTVKLRQGYVNDSVIGPVVVENLKNFHYTFDKFKKTRASRVNLSYARVLVVDDNTTNLDVARGLLGLYGIKVDCVTGGQLAIDAIRDENVKYNAIFMDHMMPEIDGIEATQMIREIDTGYARSIPIIALTANAVIGNEEMFLNKGFQAFIAKPIDLTFLDGVLRQWVRDKDAEALLPDKEIHTGVKTVDEPQILCGDISGLDIGKGLAHFHKEEIFIDVLKSFARHTKPLLDSIKEVNVDRLNEYAVIVHGIKGSSRGIFAEAAGDEAEALENAAKIGNIDFVHANNQRFIQTVSQLVSAIEDALVRSGIDAKPVKEKPDEAVLAKFLAACARYDIDEMDAAMTEIEQWDYTAADGLVRWLREQLDQGKYKDIKERLLSIVEQ